MLKIKNNKQSNKVTKAKVQNNDPLEEAIDALLQTNTQEVFGRDGLFQTLKKRLVDKMLEKEMDAHIGYDKHSKEGKGFGNRRNGSYQKTIIDEDGKQMTINVPRDREGEFEPIVVPKGIRKFTGFDEKVVSMYSRGMSVREIQEHLKEIYGTEVSHDLISQVTDGVLEEVRAWQNRPLDNTYPILYLDCIHVKARDNHTIVNKAVYLAVGVNMEGKKELLGIWISKNEGSKFWMQVVTELRNRGVKEIYVACVDGLKGFPEAINAVFPQTIVQLCVVHMVRNSVKYVSYKDLKEVTADLKKIYGAVNEKEGLKELNNFREKWDEKYPVISDMWERHWSELAPLYMFPEAIRKAIYTTNIIEAINRQIRKIIKSKGVFPNDESIEKIIYLALMNASKKWTMPISDWALALNQFTILCKQESGDREIVITQV